MTSREKTLIGAVAAAGRLWFGTQGLTRYRETVERNTNQQMEAERALSEGRTAELRGAAPQAGERVAGPIAPDQSRRCGVALSGLAPHPTHRRGNDGNADRR